MDDRSLDEFARSGEASDSTPEQSGSVSEEQTGEERGSDSRADVDEHRSEPASELVTAEPATGTARWSSDGEVCGSCSDRVSRLWFEDGEVVCSSCKEW
jgi:hypothetical protein